MPKTHFKMRRCCADLMFSSGGTFFDKSINNFTKSDVVSWNSLNACQLSWFPLPREATTCEKLNGCTDCVLKLAHPCPKPISKRGAVVRICFLFRRHLFRKTDGEFLKIWWFLIKIHKSMPAIVICIVSRGHKPWQNQCLRRLCIEIDHRCPKPTSQIGRCCSDLIFD